MNILVISHMYPNNYNENNGIFIHKQVKALKSSKEDVNIKVISPIPYTPYILTLLSKKYKGYYNIPKKAIWEGVEVFYPRVVWLPKNLNFRSSGEILYKGIKKITSKLYKEFKFDLIHAHVALPDGYGAVMLNEHFNKPLLTTIHGQDMNYTVNLDENFKNKVVHVFEKSNKVIFVSNKLKREAENITGKKNNYAVIPNGIELNDIVSKKSQSIYQEFHGKRYILVVGNLIKTKGIDYAIRAFSNIHNDYEDLNLVIIGRGIERESLEKLAFENGVADKVIFKGALPHNIVMEYMKNCYIFVLPSYKEGFGVVYIEAMAQGKLVIGCKGEGIEDVIEDFKDGILMEPRNLEDLTNKIKYVLENDSIRKDIERNAKIKVETKYTWTQSANSLYSEYLRLYQ
ncbi:glycosyltransferase [Clostridium senegalense]|uniref:glycosyltransferase n=1 Tax=Clostridium senegalense TaxID=1465809 RepID=UPI001C10E44C|nr:glycosyltransferase [Clostridium senegalense]MBU5225738.1 glycosyltransferase [Clostridium senegalense]